ncbi:MAG TPA: STAS domain-containing protein [Candidatus Ozemobacteraceae bacterium]|nr:STAS domain-containing protein [Candidatus Ozemobacteraceae bacterium]
MTPESMKGEQAVAMTLTIECFEREESVVVIDVKGEITFENADLLRDKLNELCDQGKCRLIIDLANLKYMSSAGMGVLVHGLKRTRQGKGDLKLVNLNAKMRRVFLITQFTHHFSVFPTLDEAVQSFKTP